MFETLFDAKSTTSSPLPRKGIVNQVARLNKSEVVKSRIQKKSETLYKLKESCHVPTRKHTVKSDPLKASRTDFSLGVYYLKTQNDLTLAQKHIESAHKLRLMHLGPNHVLLASSHEILGDIAREHGNVEKATQHYNKAVWIINQNENSHGTCGVVASVVQSVEKGDYEISKVKVRVQRNLRKLKKQIQVTVRKNNDTDINPTDPSHEVGEFVNFEEKNKFRYGGSTKDISIIAQCPSTDNHVSDTTVVAEIKHEPRIPAQLKDLLLVQPQMIPSKDIQETSDVRNYPVIKARVVATKEPENTEPFSKDMYDEIHQPISPISDIHFKPDLRQSLKETWIEQNKNQMNHRREKIINNPKRDDENIGHDIKFNSKPRKKGPPIFQDFHPDENDESSRNIRYAFDDIQYHPSKGRLLTQRQRSHSAGRFRSLTPNDMRETTREIWIAQRKNPNLKTNEIEKLEVGRRKPHKYLKDKIKKKIAKHRSSM